MPWLETSPMEPRERFSHDHQGALYTMVELCERYGISRKTGYTWLARFAEVGRAGVQEHSRTPHPCPHRSGEAVAALLCAARHRHPSWGPAMLLDWRHPRYPDVAWPAVSTAGDLLARRGLVQGRRRRRPYPHPGVVPATTTQPNDLWTAASKGHLRTRDGVSCSPLPIAAQHPRYLLACQGLPSVTGVGVRPVFERLFREYGLPEALRTDNGVPFAPTGSHGLSQRTGWWLRRGIQHPRLLPAPPEPTGVHERMHKTRKGEASRPPRANLGCQQRAVTAFRRLSHEERPPAALGGRTPASLSCPSGRAYPRTLPPIEYPGHCLVKRVTNAGTIRFTTRRVFIANSLQPLPIGLEEVADGIWSIHFCAVLLGRLDARDDVIRAYAHVTHVAGLLCYRCSRVHSGRCRA